MITEIKTNYIAFYLAVGNTSNLRVHMKAKHLTDYAMVDQHLKQQHQQEVSAKKGCQAHKKLVEDNTATQSKFKFQAAGPKWGSDDHPKQKLITEKIAKMIGTDMQPYSIIEDPGFREVINAAEPRYVMPSGKTFSTEIIPQLYSKTVARVKCDVNSAVSLAITTDGWTSRSNNSYLSYTAHYLTEGFEPRNYCLNVENVDESHTAQHLANSLSKCIATWISDEQRQTKLKLFVVAANAVNIQAALNKVNQCKSMNCFAVC